MRRILIALGLAAAAFAASPALAVNPDEMLKDPKLEARAREISAELRCLVCQNQSIDDSNAELAKDLRVLVRERLKAGDTNEQTLAYLVDRYGEFVLLRPSFPAHNLLLWLGPPIILLLGATGVFFALRRRRAVPGDVAPLSAEEKARLDEILAEKE